MNTLTALRLDRDRELTGDIIPEAYFRCAAVRELAYAWPSHDAERQLTEIRAAWTDKFLYLHLWAKDSWITAEDKLTVFLQLPTEDCLVWESSAAGTVSPRRVLKRQEAPDRSWKSAAQTKIRLHDAGWVWELRVPFAKDLAAAPARGQPWRVSFLRTDVDRRGRTSLSTFSDPVEGAPDVLQPSAFGQLVLT